LVNAAKRVAVDRVARPAGFAAANRARLRRRCDGVRRISRRQIITEISKLRR
jgi:hypothetical protein